MTDSRISLLSHMRGNVERRGRRSDPKPYDTLPIMKTNPITSKESSQGWYSKSPLRSFGDSSEATGRGQTPSVSPSQEQAEMLYAQSHQPWPPRGLPSSTPPAIAPSPVVFDGFVSGSSPSHCLSQVAPKDVPSLCQNFQMHSKWCPPSVAFDDAGMLYTNPDVHTKTQVSPMNFWHCQSSGLGEAEITYSDLMHAGGPSLSTQVSDLQNGAHEHVFYQYSRDYPPGFGVPTPYAPSGTTTRGPPGTGQLAYGIQNHAMAAPGNYTSMSPVYKSQSIGMTIPGGDFPDHYASMMSGTSLTVSGDSNFNFMAFDHDGHDQYGPRF